MPDDQLWKYLYLTPVPIPTNGLRLDFQQGDRQLDVTLSRTDAERLKANLESLLNILGSGSGSIDP